MSRVRRAAIAASFGYVQFGLSMVAGILLIPVTLSFLGARTYGLWLATGEILGYAAMADFGVLGVLPWMIAEADGRNDRNELRTLVANGFAVGFVIGVLYASVAGLLWLLLPSLLRLTAEDRATIGPALAMVVCLMTLVYPLRVFNAVVGGLQDVRFSGWLALGQDALGVVLTLALLWAGYGVLALAAALVVRSTFSTVASLVRIVWLAPDLLVRWPHPTWFHVRRLLVNGLGAWFGTFGWQLLTASNGLVITRIGSPEWVPIYACTAKLGNLATQLSWVIPDSGLVGLAQLYGEVRATPRVRSVVGMMLRLHLLLSGAVLCVVLVVNPSFVKVWVGDAFFGGIPLHGLLALSLLVSSLTHGLFTASAVLGNRLHVGALSFANGIAQAGLALLLGVVAGLPGIAAAALLAGLVIAVPAGVKLLSESTGLTTRTLWSDVLNPWLRPAVPVLSVATLTTIYSESLGILGALLIAVALTAVYIWRMRPLYAELPFNDHLSRWLVSLRLLPNQSNGVVPVEQS